ncbi:hypothetical protein LGN06_04395 [Burkholderia vietnamiensis]|nr:hypothetical protein [Burkholderia vietnamiensis]MCA8390805.1 hypothetical protein [Burkholderia vietnamiensis]HDR8956688.1 hypothetical protein [Burkholderia vietnamiensis]HDR9243261.1 hypothetical protein [Burkholderia vietnamiensis]
MRITLFQRSELSCPKSCAAHARGWHRLVALALLYLIASAVAPAFDI